MTTDATPEPASPREIRVEVEGNAFVWRPAEALLLISGGPSLALWIESSLAALMHSMQRMVGTERFNLTMQGGGRESVSNDWAFMSGFDSFELGFDKLSTLAYTCGWGRWELLSLDRDAKLARYAVTNGWEALYQRSLGVDWGSAFMAGKLAGLSAKLFGTHCWAEQTASQALGAERDEFEVRPSTKTTEDLLERLLETDKATRADLAVALQRLQVEVKERERAEREAKRRLAIIEAQRLDIAALATPIIQVAEGVLTLPLVGSVSKDRAAMITERLLEQIQTSQARYAIIDLTGVEDIDTHTANHLVSLARTVGLLGARCIITGIRPAVAQTLVALDAGFGAIVTLSTLRDALEYCRKG